MEAINVKCNRCKCYRTESSFNKNGRILKCCLVCREYKKKNSIKNLCIHNKRKNYCIECGGSSICIHNRQKNKCKECGGISICIHNRQKYRCKDCDGSSICIHNRQKYGCKDCGDEIKITISYMIGNSKHNDKKNNNYDPVNFIDKCFVKNLIEDCENKCYYCNCELQYIIRQPDLATIERLDNSFGHIKSNCVIACYKCNVSRVGDKLNK